VYCTPVYWYCTSSPDGAGPGGAAAGRREEGGEGSDVTEDVRPSGAQPPSGGPAAGPRRGPARPRRRRRRGGACVRTRARVRVRRPPSAAETTGRRSRASARGDGPCAPPRAGPGCAAVRALAPLSSPAAASPAGSGREGGSVSGAYVRRTRRRARRAAQFGAFLGQESFDGGREEERHGHIGDATTMTRGV